MSPMTQQPLTTEHALLGFLHQQPMHGYEIHKRMSDPQNLGQVWQVKQSQLYALLSRLEEEGFILSQMQPQNNRPPRKVFHITTLGEETFKNWLKSPVEHGREMRLDFLVKLYFALQHGQETVKLLFDAQINESQAWLNEHSGEEEFLHQGAIDYEWFVSEFRYSQIEATLSWLQKCKKHLLGQ